MGYIHTMEYYLALKRKEILTHATTWMNLKDIMLHEMSVTKRQVLYDSNLHEILRLVKLIETESTMVVDRGLRGEENEGLLFNRYRISVLQYKKSYRDGWWL